MDIEIVNGSFPMSLAMSMMQAPLSYFSMISFLKSTIIVFFLLVAPQALAKIYLGDIFKTPEFTIAHVFTEQRIMMDAYTVRCSLG